MLPDVSYHYAAEEGDAQGVFESGVGGTGVEVVGGAELSQPTEPLELGGVNKRDQEGGHGDVVMDPVLENLALVGPLLGEPLWSLGVGGDEGVVLGGA